MRAKKKAVLHSLHDYGLLVARWNRVSRRAGLRVIPLANEDGFSTFGLQSRAGARSAEAIYLSAGMHGDEPAAASGLLAWAEANVDRLAQWPLLIFPCLNPWGLVQNSRFNARGEDLNRAFHRDDQPTLAALKRVIEGRRFQVGLHLHEDYDGEGVYIYEHRRKQRGWGRELVAAAAPIIAPDPRVKIDISRGKNGLIRPGLPMRRFKTMGFPEAVWLFLHHSDHTLTFETPSEFAFEKRIAAQVAAVDALIRLAT